VKLSQDEVLDAQQTLAEHTAPTKTAAELLAEHTAPTKTAAELLAEHAERLRPKRTIPAVDDRPRWLGKIGAPVTKQSY
jgi:hypothetical protein